MTNAELAAEMRKLSTQRWAILYEHDDLFRQVAAALTRPEAALPKDGGITLALVQMARENAIEECAEICDAIRVERNAVADSDVALGALMCRDALRGPQRQPEGSDK